MLSRKCKRFNSFYFIPFVRFCHLEKILNVTFDHKLHETCSLFFFFTRFTHHIEWIGEMSLKLGYPTPEGHE